MKSVSIVVPVYNEEGNVKKLYEEIKHVCQLNKYILMVTLELQKKRANLVSKII